MSSIDLHAVADPMVVRGAFARFPSGVAVLAVETGPDKHALVASSFMVGVSLDPCLVAVAVQKTSETWGLIEGASAIGVSIFSKGQGDLTRKLAGKDRAARFEEVAIESGDDGALFIQDAALWLSCAVHEVLPAGDHWMVLLEVNQIGVSEHDPLVWFGAKFRELQSAQTVDVE